MKHINAICPRETLEIARCINVYSSHASKTNRGAKCEIATLVEKGTYISKKVCAYTSVTHNTNGCGTFRKTSVDFDGGMNPTFMGPVLPIQPTRVLLQILSKLSY